MGGETWTICIPSLQIALAIALEPDLKLILNYFTRCCKTEVCAY